MRTSVFVATLALMLVAFVAPRASAQPTTPDPPPTSEPPKPERFERAPALETIPETIPQETPPPPPPPPPAPEAPTRLSEGRLLVSAYNVGFQWGLSPGVVVWKGDAGFFLGANAGYGFDLGSVIVVPGARIGLYFTDPKVYLGMPVVKVVLPIDRVGPFVEVGAGLGDVTDPATLGVALSGGGGIVVYFNHIAVGAQASYQVVTGTSFKSLGFGPIIAWGF